MDIKKITYYVKHNKKRIIVVSTSVLFAVAILVSAFVFVRCSKSTKHEAKKDDITTFLDLQIDTIETEIVIETEAETELVTLEEPKIETEPEVIETESYVETATPIVVEEPVYEPYEEPINTSSQNSDGLSFGGTQEENTQVYSCGSPRHVCTSPESHAYICEMETRGCSICGSHTCPSFYGKDQWGGSGVFLNKCPQYDIHKDPVYYCQICHKKAGDGKNNTCVFYLQSTNCYNCGEYVESMTCHTCK